MTGWGDRKGHPYESVIRGAVQDRRATARVAPTVGYRKCGGAGGQRRPPLRKCVVGAGFYPAHGGKAPPLRTPCYAIPQKKETPEGVSFYCIRCESYLLYRALSAAAISAKIPACFLPTTTRITSRVAIIRTIAIIMQITTFCSRPAMMKLTKETAATVTP